MTLQHRSQAGGRHHDRDHEQGQDDRCEQRSESTEDDATLDQINADNVGKLKVAFIQQVGRSTRGLETTPLAKDGILFYSGSYSKVFAVNGATGEMLWSFIPKLDEDTVARQTHSPYNRGLAMGFGNLYVGTVDGRLIAIDNSLGDRSVDHSFHFSESVRGR